MAPSFDCCASLYCNEEVGGSAWEDETSSYSDEDELVNAWPVSTFIAVPVETDDVISAMLEKESAHMPLKDYLQRFQTKTIDLSVRDLAVGWMLKVHGQQRFGPLTAVLSVNYLDRFLSRHPVPQGKAWMPQLLSVACFSLAAKMEEPDVPCLIDLQVEVGHLFEPRIIQRMELLVLSTLEWRMSAVTPFSYINYYMHKLGFDDLWRKEMQAQISDYILSTLKDISFLAFPPSVIAAAAVLSAMLDSHGASAVADGMKALSAAISIDRDAVEKCYRLMQGIHQMGLFRSVLKRKPGCFSVPQSPVGVLEVTSFSCDSESTLRSVESSPNVHIVSSPSVKKRKIKDFCNPNQNEYEIIEG